MRRWVGGTLFVTAVLAVRMVFLDPAGLRLYGSDVQKAANPVSPPSPSVAASNAELTSSPPPPQSPPDRRPVRPATSGKRLQLPPDGASAAAIFTNASANNAANFAANGTTTCSRASLSRRRRLLHWNILDGGAERIHGITRYLRDGAYDLVTLNELNGFTSASLAAFGQRCGMPHVELLAKSRYHLGVLSRHPLKRITSETGTEFAHGLLCVRALGMNLCVAHLHPQDVRRRAAEAKRIVRRHVQPAVKRRRPFMLVGDMNTLSSLDRSAHDAAGLTRKITHGPYARPLGKKFLNPGRTAIDYTPMDVLLDAPLIDVGAGGGHSVPTSVNADHMHFATLRLDYCLVSRDLIAAAQAHSQEVSCAPEASAPHGTGEPVAGGSGRGIGRPRGVMATLVRDDRTNALSDHFPLEILFHGPSDTSNQEGVDLDGS